MIAQRDALRITVSRLRALVRRAAISLNDCAELSNLNRETKRLIKAVAEALNNERDPSASTPSPDVVAVDLTNKSP
jgi:hypothetical protein